MSPPRRTPANRGNYPAPSRVATIVKGLGSLLLLLGFVAGVPYLLIRIGAFPSTVPDPAALWQAAIGPDLSGRSVFVVLAALVWIGWAWFTLSVLRETAAAVRSRGRRPARTPRRMSGAMSWSVQPAAILVAAIVAMFITTPLLAAGAPPALAAGGPGADPAPRAGIVAAATHTSTQTDASSTGAKAQHSSPGPAAATTSTTTSTPQGSQHPAQRAKAPSSKAANTKPTAATTPYTVRRYDTLWSIAQKQLGDPTRYREIVKLNPHLQRDTTIHSGDVLLLPHHGGRATTTAGADRTAAAAASSTAGPVEQVTVQRGDTLSEISAERGVSDWHTVWAANKGKAEPGGKRFTNPDHIEVGWTLTVPTTAKSAKAPAAPVPANASTTAAAGPPAAATIAPTPPHVAPDQAASVGAEHRHGPLGEATSPAHPGSSGEAAAPAPQASTQPGQTQASATPETQGQHNGQAGSVAPTDSVTNSVTNSATSSAGDSVDGSSLATVSGYVTGGSVLAAGIYGALVLVRRQQWRERRPGRTIAATPSRLIPIERAIVTAAPPSADETARVDQVLRRVAATDIETLHVAAVQLTAGDITVHLSEPAALPAPWLLNADYAATGATGGDDSPDETQDDLPGDGPSSGLVWTFPAGADAEEAGADPAVVGAIAPFPTLVHIGSDAGSAWLLNLEQTGALVLTGDRERCLALARVMSAQLAVNAWAELVTVTMLGFGQELVETAPSRLRHAPLDRAGAVLASATSSATTTANYCDQFDLAVVEARRSAAHDEAWGVHVLVTAPAVAAEPTDNTDGGEDHRPRLAELLEVLHGRAGTTAAAVVVVDEHPQDHGFAGATIAHLDPAGTLTLPDVGLSVQATGWDEETSRGVGMLMAHLRNAPDQQVPQASGDQPWQQLSDAAGALRADLVQPRSTPAVHDSSRPTGATTLPLADEAYVDVAATTAEDLQVLAPTVSADVLDQVMALDPNLDEDVAAWFDRGSPRAKLAVLGPLVLTTTQPAPKRVAYYAELAAYLTFNQHGATAEQITETFHLTNATSRAYLSTLREYLGKDPATGREYMPAAKDSAAGRARGVGVYQIDGLLLDADLFRRLRLRGQARGPAGLEDYATALRLVTGPPFAQLRDEGGAWLLAGDRVDHHLTVAVADVAHLLATNALAAGDTTSARAAVDIARLAAPDEETPRLDAAAVAKAEGNAAEARRTLVEQVCNRSDDGEVPMDLNPRTRQILARHRDWLSRAS